MKAVIFHGNGRFSVEEKAVPEISSADEVLLKVKAASICGSDLHVLNVPPGQYAKPGIILGHEFCGEIVEKGGRTEEFRTGDRVIVEPIIKCGICEACRHGYENLCQHSEIIGQTRDGGFAEYCVVPKRYLYKIPDGVSDCTAALAEPVACVMHGILKLQPMAHEKAVIFGAGSIGLIFLKVLQYYGFRDIIVCEPEKKRREDALRMGDCCTVVDPMNEQLQEIVLKRWGRGADIVIDAVGMGTVMEQALPVLKFGGRLLIFGQNATQFSTIKPSDINTKELTVFGTMSTRDSFPAAIDLLKDPDFGVEAVVSHRLGLEDFEKGLDLMRTRRGTKIIILPQERRQ